MCGIIGYIGPKDVVPGPHRGAAAARVSRLRLGGRRGRRATARSSCAAAPASWRTSRDVIAQRSARRRLRHRPHALGDARPADRGERAPAPRLHRQDRRRPQRHHRELPRAEAASCSAQGHTFVTETDTEIVAHLVEREMKDDGLENAVRRALHADARAVRARADLGRRSGEDRRRPQRPADRRRPRRGRVLRRLRHPGDPQPHARRRLPRRRGDGGHHARRASSSPTSTARPVVASRRSACSGIRSWPRRAATSTSCSRRSTSSRAPRARRSSAACRRTRGQVFLDELKITDAELARDRAGHDPRLRHVVARRRWSASS